MIDRKQYSLSLVPRPSITANAVEVAVIEGLGTRLSIASISRAGLIPRLQPGNETSTCNSIHTPLHCHCQNATRKDNKCFPISTMLVFSLCQGGVLVAVGQCGTASLLECSRRGTPPPGGWCHNGSVHPHRGH